VSTCKCDRDALGDLVKRTHDAGCPDAGKRSGKGGKRTPKMAEARSSRRVEVQIEGGKDALLAAAARAGYVSGSALVADVVRRIGKGEKLFRDPC